MATGITLEKALKVFTKELGCPGNYDDGREFLLDHIQTAIEFILLNGGGEILREWKVTVRHGRFTLPRDLETPVKYKVGSDANCGYGTFNTVYYPYSSQSIANCCGYRNWSDYRLSIKPNRVPTQFQPPKTGVRLVATTRDDKDVGKHIMVGGKRCGFPIKGTHLGHKTEGEFLTIYKECDPNKKYSAFIFDEITSVEKDLTCDYVMLSGIDEGCHEWWFLSHYTPDETVPMYTECEMYGCGKGSCDFTLDVLGRVSPNIKYTREQEILPISSLEMLRLLAKRARFDESDAYDDVAKIEQRLRVLILKQVAYQKGANEGLSFSLPTSGASLTHM